MWRTGKRAEPGCGVRFGNVRQEFGFAVDFGKASQKAAHVHFVAGQVPADCVCVNCEAHRTHSVYLLSSVSRGICRDSSSALQAALPGVAFLKGLTRIVSQPLPRKWIFQQVTYRLNEHISSGRKPDIFSIPSV